MRALTASLALVVSLTLAACGSSEAAAAPPGQDPHAMVAAGATLLDVRTPGEFAGGHLEGALNIPIADLEGRLDEVPSDQPVVVYCRSGARSAAAASTLRDRGYQVHDLGPMSAW